MPRPKKDAKPKLKAGLYKNPGSTTWHYHLRYLGIVRKGNTNESNEQLARSEVERLKEIWKAEARGNVAPTPKEVAPTLENLWEEWDRLVGAVKSKTYRRYMKGAIHQHLGEWLDMPATRLDSDALETLRSRYMTSEGKGYKRGGGHTVRKHSEGGWNRVFGQVRTLLKWAVMKKRIPAIPYEIPAKDIRLKSSAKTHGVLWPEEVAGFLEAVDTGKRTGKGGKGKKGADPYRETSIAIRLMLNLGLREGEALHMEWERIDWRRKVAIVAEARTTGQKTKDRSVREVPIGSDLEAYLRGWWERQGQPKAGLLIPNQAGWAYSEGATKNAVQRGATALERILTPHGLRATFATGHWEVGTSLSQIAQMMGDNPEVVTKHYIFERPKDQAASQEKLEAAMRASKIEAPK